MKNHLSSRLVFLTLLFTSLLTAQKDTTWTSKIDSLFTEWNRPNHPGGAIGVAKDGKTFFSKAYGLASLEYLVPNSNNTIFNTGSVSKQFTAMGIVLLEEQGKLSFDDEIHQHIPELPDFGHPITIRHLLHHTSGLRSLHALFALAGWRGDDARTNEDLNRFILKQQDLNFEPGTEYLYCNTGYMLMVNIIENATGAPVPAWMRDNIFEPLGMTHTYVEDQYNRVVPDNATSYYGRDRFDRAVEYWGYVGSGNMHSTTADLLRWLSNFRAPQKGWESAFRKMQTLDPFNDGTPNNYAFGVVADKYLGKARIQHGGAVGGFRAFVATYPEEDLDIVVLTNFSAGNPRGNADAIARIILGATEAENTKSSEIASVELSEPALKKFEGAYWNPRQKYLRKIYLKNDTLRYFRAEENESALIPVGSNAFAMTGAGAGLTVTFKGTGASRQMEVTSGDDTPALLTFVETTEATEAERASQVGTYYSTEVETSYRISEEEGEMQAYHPRHGSIPLKRLFRDVYSTEGSTGIVEIQRNPEGAVTGILISNGRVRNAWFEKQ